MRLLLSIIIIGISNTLIAQSFKLSAEIRPRTELRDGYKTLFDEDDHFAFQTSQRTKLNFDYNKDQLSLYISIQDVRLWGEIPWKNKTATTFLNEAWAKIDFSESFSAKFGRQPLIYDNQRLFTVSNWSQITAKHDALKFQYRDNGWEVDLVTAYNQSDNHIIGTLYSVDKFYKSLNVIWISKKVGDFKFSTLHIFDSSQDQLEANNSYTRHTSGISMNYYGSKFKLYSGFYYQAGSVKANEHISAYYYNIEAIIKLNKVHSLVAGIDVISGNKEENDNNNSFDILYGKRHGMNGYMDYFNTPKTTKGAGLVDHYLKFKTKLSSKSDLSVDYHYLRIAEAQISTGAILNKVLGSEFDITYKYKYSKDINLQLGYSMMFASESAKIIKGGTKAFGQFAYLMLTIKPELFSSK